MTSNYVPDLHMADWVCPQVQPEAALHYEDEEEEDGDEPQQEEEDSDEADMRPAKRKRVPVPRPTAGTPAKPESLEEVEQRLQPGSVKHAIFQVCHTYSYAIDKYSNSTNGTSKCMAGEDMSVPADFQRLMALCTIHTHIV